MKFYTPKRNKGFTLVELMVVVSIIGILASIVYANFGNARKASRDEIRKTSLKELQLAVEFYKAQNGVYPAGCASNNSFQWSGNVNGDARCINPGEDYIIGLVPDYISSLPLDPKAATNVGNAGYLYWVNTNRDQYKIMATAVVEKLFINSYEDEFARCPSPKGNEHCPSGARPASFTSYAVYKGSIAETY